MKLHVQRAVAAATFFAMVAAAAVAARGEPIAPHKLGEHPAVIVKRLSKTAGYDYAAQFYPHPAWLYLRSDAAAAPQDGPVVALDAGRRDTPRRDVNGPMRRVPGAADVLPRQASRTQMVQVPFTD